MNIGVPREARQDEFRVGLTPAGVEVLVAAGHTCLVERDAGRGAGFTDEDYARAGARIVYSAEEAYRRADLVLKVERPKAEEVELLRDGCTVMGYMHLAVAPKDRIQRLLEKRITIIAYETIQHEDGSLPVLAPLSQAAGRMVPEIAAGLLHNDRGGKGILLGGVPGVPPAEVVIIGAGTFGVAATRGFLGTGASVHVLDRDLARLQRIDESCRAGGRLVTMVSHAHNIRKAVAFADVVVGAVLVPGTRSPIVVTRELVKSMKPRSVILDIAIDQGGCVETSRPTTHREPTYVEENVIHYCVPNMTSVVARTATHALSNVALSYITEIAGEGLDAALAGMPELRRGVITFRGTVTNAAVAAHVGVPEVSL
jgi:alanine dehydrogenase